MNFNKAIALVAASVALVNIFSGNVIAAGIWNCVAVLWLILNKMERPDAEA